MLLFTTFYHIKNIFFHSIKIQIFRFYSFYLEIEIEAPGGTEESTSTEVEPKVKIEKKLSVTFQPTGEDNPEAAGVVLRSK